jgi:NAD(P)-dependent dehydrogenase (short-subunit alcohol dehydrogenase family)
MVVRADGSAGPGAMSLEGKVAIVTGASRGLGRAMALALASAGADVALAARSVADLDETARQVEKMGRRALVVPTDVSAYDQVESLMQRAIAGLGGLHIVVNNSGIARVTPLAEMPPEEFERTLRVNLVGVFNGCRAAAAHLIAQKSGKIINIASVLGQVGLPGYTAYAASKGGVTALTRALSAEWARHNIQVNALAPGWFVTDMNADAFADPKIRERLLRDVPARRTGRPEEIGPLLVYLASPASDFMTGQTLFLDGGHSAA